MPPQGGDDAVDDVPCRRRDNRLRWVQARRGGYEEGGRRRSWIRAGDRCSGPRQPNGRITRGMNRSDLLVGTVSLAFTLPLAFSLALAFPLAVLAFPVLALIIALSVQ